MAKSFNRWNPICHGYFPQPQIQPHSVKPKVINIPVQFIGTNDRNNKLSPATPPAANLVVPSEEARVSAAATIQRAVRGFLVRKNAHAVHQVSIEVDVIERKLKVEEAKIRLDARERLRVNETLMALLLRLDSVRGVREFRKKVIRRVIALQEKIDSIPAATDGTIGIGEDREDSSNEAANESSIDSERAADQTLDAEEETNGEEIELEMEIPVAVESRNRMSDLIAAGDAMISTSGISEDLKDSMGEAADKSSIYHEDQTLEPEEDTNKASTEIEMKIHDVHESPEMESNVIGFEIVRNGLSSPEAAEFPKGNGIVSVVESAAEEEGIVMRKLVERMAAENERMKEMVEKLCATNAEQCRVMEGLANRVEHLEHFVHRMDRRRKSRRKRRGAACSTISSPK